MIIGAITKNPWKSIQLAVILSIAAISPKPLCAQYYIHDDFCLDSLSIERNIFEKRNRLFLELSNQFNSNYSETACQNLEDKAAIEFVLDTFTINERGRIIEDWLNRITNQWGEDDTLCLTDGGSLHYSTATSVSLDFLKFGFSHLISKYNSKIVDMITKEEQKLMDKEIKSWWDWHLARMAILDNNLDDSYAGGGNHIRTTYPSTEVEWLKARANILGNRFIGLKLNESMRLGY